MPGHADALQDQVFISEVDLFSAVGLLGDPAGYRRARNSLGNLGRMGQIAPAMRQLMVEDPPGSGLHFSIDPPADPFVFGHIDPDRWLGIDVSGSGLIYPSFRRGCGHSSPGEPGLLTVE